jgi:choline dehydrogenase-like flavoprotein
LMDWPIEWQELCRYYAMAERLFRVAGTRDPLAKEPATLRLPPPPSGVDAVLMCAFMDRGLHPYRLHVGIAYGPGCGECGGKVCPVRCKSDARVICLDPAVAQHGATLLCDAQVVRIDADATHATGVRYTRQGRETVARGRIVILSAGAYRSPALLLRSTGPDWPMGLANRNDQVGRNLMFHANEWFALWSPHRAATTGPRKTIGLRDLYTHRGMRLGSIQSTGLSAHAGNIETYPDVGSGAARATPVRGGDDLRHDRRGSGLSRQSRRSGSRRFVAHRHPLSRPRRAAPPDRHRAAFDPAGIAWPARDATSE